MEVIAVSKSVRIAPRKIRIVADAVRKLDLENALTSLSVINKRGATPVLKTIKSAIANAKNNKNIEQDVLRIKAIEVTEAQSFKRFHPSTRGRVHTYKRRGSHIKVVLTDNASMQKKTETALALKSDFKNIKKEEEK